MTSRRAHRRFSEDEYTRMLGAGIVGSGARLVAGTVREGARGGPRRFSVADYHRMLEVGVLYSGDPCELLAGEIWEAAGIGNRHWACVNRLGRLLLLDLADRAIVSIQGSLTLGDDSEPEPDVAVLAWRDDFYESGKPTAEDALLVIEVADSSYAEDRRMKLPLYARDAVVELWIVDVIGRTIETYLDPLEGRYRTVDRYRSGATISPRMLPDLRLEVDGIVPPLSRPAGFQA